MIAVCDTTPLVNLAAIGQFDLLRRLHDRVYVPDAVFAEVTQEGAGRPGDAETRAAEWLHRQPVAGSALLRSLQGVLDPGECEAIALYEKLGADRLLMDELRGRKVARKLGVRVTGTVGLLIEAKQEGHLAMIKPHLDALRKRGFWMSEALYRNTLQAVAEHH